MSERNKPDAAMYRRVFRDSREGALIVEDLVRRFSRIQKGSGFDRLFNLAQLEGRRDVLDFIVDISNREEGAVPNESTEGDE